MYRLRFEMKHIIAQLGAFAIPTTATAGAATLELSADGTTVIITLAGAITNGVFPSGIFTPSATQNDLAGNTIDVAVLMFERSPNARKSCQHV